MDSKMKWIKKILGVTALESEISKARQEAEQYKKEAEQYKKETEELQSDAKSRATALNEPYIEIVAMELNTDNPSLGSFELDWNEQFIKKLRAMGYPGPTDEVVIDLWFQDVCRNILLETYEQEQANRAVGDNVRYISRRDIGGGKTEVS
jgi:hypothetical protein